MIKDTLFYKILSAVHIVFFTSILCFGTIFLTGTLLILPAFGAMFEIGKDYIGKKLDITDSIIGIYFENLKKSLRLLKFFPVNILLLLNIAGMFAAERVININIIYSVLCLALISLLLVFMLYIAGYYAFVNEQVDIMEVFMCMFIKPVYLLPVFLVVVLSLIFFSGILMAILCLLGTFFLFVLEVVILIQMLYYKKMAGKPEDELMYLIEPAKKKNN